jgi:hypothetical protein
MSESCYVDLVEFLKCLSNLIRFAREHPEAAKRLAEVLCAESVAKQSEVDNPDIPF